MAEKTAEAADKTTEATPSRDCGVALCCCRFANAGAIRRATARASGAYAATAASSAYAYASASPGGTDASGSRRVNARDRNSAKPCRRWTPLRTNPSQPPA